MNFFHLKDNQDEPGSSQPTVFDYMHPLDWAGRKQENPWSTALPSDFNSEKLRLALAQKIVSETGIAVCDGFDPVGFACLLHMCEGRVAIFITAQPHLQWNEGTNLALIQKLLRVGFQAGYDTIHIAHTKEQQDALQLAAELLFETSDDKEKPIFPDQAWEGAISSKRWQSHFQ